jgi:hypothetical protein
MASPLFTLSGAHRAALCPGSMALPRVGHVSIKADAGNAGHAYTQILIEEGREEAEFRAPDIAERWGLEGDDAARWFGAMRAWKPQAPRGSICELPLAYLEDGSVVRARGGQGSYDAPDGTLWAGTVDVAWAEPKPFVGGDDGAPRAPRGATAWLADWKFGQDDYVPPVRRNLQVRIGAVMLARWTGAERVVPAVCFAAGGGAGRWDVPLDGEGGAIPLGPGELAQIEAEARAVAERGREQRRRAAEGRPIDLVTGDHCRYCPCRAACPAHTSEAAALVRGQVDFARARDLSPEEAARLAGLLGPAREVLDGARDTLVAYVEAHGPIALPDGRVWGPQPTTRRRLRTRDTYEELQAELAEIVGEERAGELADEAFGGSVAALKRVIKAARAEAGIRNRGGIKTALDAVLGRVRERGGETVSEGVTFKAHYPGQATGDEEGEAA